MVLSKKLICLSLLLSASLISTSTDASEPSRIERIGCKTVSAGLATIAAGAATVAGAPVAIVILAGGGTYLGWRYFWSPSQATIIAKESLAKVEDLASVMTKLKDSTLEKENNNLTEQIKELKVKHEQLEKLYIEAQERANKGLIVKGKEALISLKNALPATFLVKFGKKYEATVNILKNGVGIVWNVTFKKHPYLTGTVIVTIITVPVIYKINKKFGKKISEKWVCIFMPKKLALQKSQAIGADNSDAIIDI